MKTQIKIWQYAPENIAEEIAKIAKIESIKKADGEVFLTMREQCSDEVLSELHQKHPIGIIFLTDHFWYSEMQRKIRAASNYPILRCVIAGENKVFTKRSLLSVTRATWDDMIYLGYGYGIDG